MILIYSTKFSVKLFLKKVLIQRVSEIQRLTEIQELNYSTKY